MRRGLLLLVVLAALVWPAAASAAGFGSAEVARSETTGKVRFVGSDAGRPLARSAGVTAASAPAAAGRAFLREHRPEFGVASDDGLPTLRAIARAGGGATVRYQQTIDGVPVLGGEFAVTLDGANRVLSVGGEALPVETTDTTPRLGAPAATDAAIAAVAKADRVAPGALVAGEPAL